MSEAKRVHCRAALCTALAAAGLGLMPIGPVAGQGTEQANPPADVLQELDATLRSIKFYPIGDVIPPSTERKYREQFEFASTQFVGTELTFDFTAPDEMREFSVQCQYGREGEDPMAPFTIDFTVQPGWTAVFWGQGLGWKDPGNWSVGTYQVTCTSAGRAVATGSFEIVDGPAQLSALNGKVSRIRFYESGGDHVPVDERTYATTFEASETRYVRVEVVVVFPELGEAAQVPVGCMFIRPDGTIMGSLNLSLEPEVGWTSIQSSRGFGAVTPGSWSAGRYRVACFGEGTLLGEATFTVS